jgi:hypothetical protein
VTATAKPAPAAPAAAASPKPPANAAPQPAPQPPANAAAQAAPAPVSGTVQEKLQANKELTREVQAKLPGADVLSAASGFSTLQQFVSAAHASHNLSLSFDALKAKLLGGKRTSLRQAIEELKPAASATIEAQRAEYDAMGMILAAEQAAAAAAAQPAKAKPSTAPSKPAPKAKAPARASAAGQE